MTALRRNPFAAGVVILLVGCVVVFGVFLTLLRSIGSDRFSRAPAAEPADRVRT